MQPPRELLARQVRQRLEERLLVAADHPGVLGREEMPDEGRGIGVGAAHQAQEVVATALLVARELQGRDQHREEDLLAGQRAARGFPLDAPEELDALLVHRVEPAREDRLEELFLRAEVVVDRGEVHAGGRGEAAQARRLEAVLDEELLGRVEDAGLRVCGGRVERDGLSRHKTTDSNERLKFYPK